MKIFHLASEYPPIQVFGLGRAVHDLAVAQAALGGEVHVVTNSVGGRDQEVVNDCVFVHRIDFPPPPKPPDDTMAVTQFNISAVETAARTIDRIGVPDVLHVHDWLTVLCGRMLKWLHPEARLAATIHDTAQGKYFGQLDRPQQYTAHLERWIGMEADAIICCSQHVRGEMIQQYGCAPEKITVIPCGVDEAQFEVTGDLATFKTMFGRGDDRLVLYVGRLDREKGINVLIDAMAQVAAIEPRAKLLIVGKGQLQETLQEQIRGLNLGDRAQFAGYLTGNVLAAVMRSAEVLVVPSLYEPFGIVALEGMINRTAVIASDSSGLAEIITDGQTGLRVPPRDVKALAQAILQLLSSDELRAGLAERGYECASTQYRWADIARSTCEAYGVTAPAEAAAGS